jgi:hypothetical protein
MHRSVAFGRIDGYCGQLEVGHCLDLDVVCQ